MLDWRGEILGSLCPMVYRMFRSPTRGRQLPSLMTFPRSNKAPGHTSPDTRLGRGVPHPHQIGETKSAFLTVTSVCGNWTAVASCASRNWQSSTFWEDPHV